AVALASGLAGGIISRLTLRGVAGIGARITTARWGGPVLFAALCGLLVAAVGQYSGGLTYGTGYAEARSVLEGQVHLPWFYGPARALATLAAYLSGIPAGLLAPSLSVGAGLGQIVADIGGRPTAAPFGVLGV